MSVRARDKPLTREKYFSNTCVKLFSTVCFPNGPGYRVEQLAEQWSERELSNGTSHAGDAFVYKF